jgi:transposase
VGWQKAAVALANKNARIVWGLLAKGRVFDPNYVSVNPGKPRGVTLAVTLA